MCFSLCVAEPTRPWSGSNPRFHTQVQRLGAPITLVAAVAPLFKCYYSKLPILVPPCLPDSPGNIECVVRERVSNGSPKWHYQTLYDTKLWRRCLQIPETFISYYKSFLTSTLLGFLRFFLLGEIHIFVLQTRGEPKTAKHLIPIKSTYSGPNCYLPDIREKIALNI